jgi:NAD(P)H-dependent FMN reductase
MHSYPKILAVCGSTRKLSTNHQLLDIIRGLFAGTIGFETYEGLASLPHFNPDLDTDHPPAAVAEFRDQLRAADGVLICTPEYAMGVPGTLKNALDWIVSSMELSKKPVALITASSIGEHAHESLIRTLLVIESDLPESSRLLIPFVKSRIKDGKITDEALLEQVKAVIGSLMNAIRRVR